MGGVGGAVDRTVGDEHQQLAAAPPSMQRPAGAPQTLEGKPKADAPARYSQDPAQKSEAPKDEKAEVTGEKKPEGQIEAEKAEEPGGWDTFKMALGFVGAKIVNGVTSLFGADEPVVDPQELAAKFAGLPTKDEALKQAQAGNAPGVEMQGAAEQTAGEQGAAVDSKGQETVATGKDDAARPMGENQVYPNAPKEQLKGKVPGQQGGKGGVPGGEGAGTGAVPAEAASEVAEHDRGPEFQRAFTQGQKGMSEGRQAKDRDFRDSQHKHKQKVDSEVGKNTDAQASERGKTLDEVTSQRADWRTEQDEELKKLGTKKTEKHEKVRKDVKEREKKTDDDVEQEKKDSDTKIQEKAATAESDAKNKTDTAAKESGNWVTKAFEWLKEKVIEIKNAIVRIIRAARDAVVNFIKNFKENAERWINEARKFIVDTVKNLINDLIEFAKAMVRAVIELANRIRKFITDLIAAAIAFVTKLAAQLKQIVSDLLNALAKLLSDILNILKKMLMDVVKAVVDAVKTVLDYASKLLAGLGEFMMIAVDFLSDPGGWLSGAKNSAVDGAKNHLFREVQAAVKSWFQSKIEEIIGIPKAIIDKLIKGGFTLEKIVKETWDAIVPQLPFIIGEIVITKVIAKLIPGAGWVMAVIDAIRTAIGALGEILRAMGAVLDWLKAVRLGGAGVLFAKAVAAGIVALLELAYEALLSGIGKYVAKVGRRLKGVAAKLGKRDGGGDKPKPAQGDDPKPADPKPARPTSTDTLPKPGKATGPSTKPNAKPEPKADPNRPTTQAPGKDRGPGREQDATPGKPKGDRTGDNGRPTDRDRPGRPATDKDAPGKPDTRPTPAAKPKPEPKPKPKPEPEPDTKPKPKDDASGKPRDDKDTTKPKDDDKTPQKDQDPNRPKSDKPKDKGADRDPKKPAPKGDKDGGRKPKPKDGDKGPRKPKDGKSQDKGPAEAKREKKNERKKEEDSKESKDARLEKIVARLRPKLTAVTQRGIGNLPLRALLKTLRAWYRLTALQQQKTGEQEKITAVLNPQKDARDHLEQARNIIEGNEPDFARAIGNEANRVATDPRVAGLAAAVNAAQAQGQSARDAARKAAREQGERDGLSDKQIKDRERQAAATVPPRPAAAPIVESVAMQTGARPIGYETIDMAARSHMAAIVGELHRGARGRSNPANTQVQTGLGSGHYHQKPAKAGGTPRDAIPQKLQKLEDAIVRDMQGTTLSSTQKHATARERIQKAYFEILQGRIPSDQFFRQDPEAVKTIAGAARLMGVVEGGRHVTASLTGIMAWKASTIPDVTWENVVNDMNYMAPKDAPKSADYMYDPEQLARDHSKKTEPGLTSHGRKINTATPKMQARMTSLLIHSFAQYKAENIYLGKQQLIDEFPDWVLRNSVPYLSPEGGLKASSAPGPGWVQTGDGLWVPQ
ncbi:hypothetical protein [Streptomyces chartreusis]|uniref:hypothetical protein n=1 Tax=Streptomyces chartreusis TaxID=1969 RepID=UPI0033A1799D